MSSAGLDAGVVVVGGGIAGASCVTALRRRGFDGTITMVSAENTLPYDRTLLSKSLFDQESLSEERLILHTAEHYDEIEVDVHLGVAATQLAPRAREVTLEDGRVLTYGAVVLCTGGEARLPDRLNVPGVRTLRSLQDSIALTDDLAPGRRLIVIGGGFIGAEIASTAAANGVDVVLLEAQDAPLAAAVGLEVGSRIAELQRAAGVEILTGAMVARVDQRRTGFQVVLDNGNTLLGDVVLAAVGMTPATDWAQTSGIPVQDGIVTGPTSALSTPGSNVFAAGDCARWWHGRYQSLVRVEHWDTAKRHGEAAAAAVLGATDGFAPVPFFWSHQGKEQYHWVGYAPSWDLVQIEEGEAHNVFTARYFVNGVMSAMMAANSPRSAALARRELEAQRPMTAAN